MFRFHVVRSWATRMTCGLGSRRAPGWTTSVALVGAGSGFGLTARVFYPKADSKRAMVAADSVSSGVIPRQPTLASAWTMKPVLTP